jgi:ribose transport system ATP-binding protein
MRDGRRVATMPLAETTVEGLVRLMANRDVGEHFPKITQSRGPELLRAEHVTRAPAVIDVSFSLHAGEVLGIGGLLGAGRSELAHILAGADQPDSGAIVIDDRAVSLPTPRHAIGRGIGLLPEDRKAQGLVAALTAERNITLPHAAHLSRLGVLRRGAEAALARPVMSDLRIKATASQAVRLLSGGNQQKVVLGKWLAGEARIFIFDEPTRGVDVGAKIEIYQLMNRLTARGAGIIMISSELPELLGMSDRILVMHRGRVQAEFDRAAASEERVLSAALGLPS